MENLSEFMGLSKKSAQNKAEARGWLFLLHKKDGELFMDLPKEPRTDRVCIELNNGEVTAAWIN